MLIIMRGLPGSGKSYLTQLIKDKTHATVCSADHFFEKNGEYNFDPAKLGQAHKKCMDKAVALFKKNKPALIDNTNTTLGEMLPYIELGFTSVFIVEPYTQWRFNLDCLESKNQHGVPRETLEKMLKRWQNKEDVLKQIQKRITYIDKRYELIEHNLI